MDCREFRRLFDDLLAGRLPEARRHDASVHVESCGECHELFAAAGWDEMVPTYDDGVELTRSILARTSGPACERAHDLIGNEVDGDLADMDVELLRSHIEHCVGCAELARAMAWTQSLLPAMAEIEPDAGFALEVFGATTGAERRATAPKWLARLRERGRDVWMRPRFSLEGAYIGTLLLVLLFETPFSPARNAPHRALEVMRAGSSTMAASLAPDLSGLRGGAAGLGESIWVGSGAHLVGTLREFGTDLEERAHRTAPATADLRTDAGKMIDAAKELDLGDASDHLGAIGGDVARIWRGFFRKDPAPTETKQEVGQTDARDITLVSSVSEIRKGECHERRRTT